MFVNNYIINPDPYLLPTYRISPFTTSDLSKNRELVQEYTIDDYFAQRFLKKNYSYTLNARQAINIALRYYSLNKQDVITILTTTGNFYISSCVTQEIEKFCKWSRKIEPETKVIFVNHEFGFPFDDLIEIKKSTGLPIIEDCAHSFFSRDKMNSIGNIGDFVIYSFPKMFPLQIGGLIVTPFELDNSKFIDNVSKCYILKVLSYYIKSKNEIVDRRLINYYYLSDKFNQLGCETRFEIEKGVVPGVFMFSVKGQNIDLQHLKSYFYLHGIQCSVFYGEESFFLPVNQALNKYDLLYFVEVFKSYLNKTK